MRRKGFGWVWVVGVVMCSCGHDWDGLEQELQAEQLASVGVHKEAGTDGTCPTDGGVSERGTEEAGDAEHDSHKRK